MKAMILAAGRGERMRPLTDSLPKPLLEVGGKPLIVYHLEKLAAIGIVDVIINVAYLAEKMCDYLGNGSRWGLRIHYSREPEALETGGALLQALPLLGDEPFLLINGDVWVDIAFDEIPMTLSPDSLARLYLVDNPSHNRAGDFAIEQGRVIAKPASDTANCQSYTFSGIAVISPLLITRYPEQRKIFPLREVFYYFIQRKKLEAVLYQGVWCDVGTPERLQQINQRLISEC